MTDFCVESLDSDAPVSNLDPVVRVTRQLQFSDSWQEHCLFFKREKDELAGYIFDPELLREGSD